MENQELYHHGIKGMRWGVRNGPPYPLKVHQNVINRAFGKITGHYARQNMNINLPKNEREARRRGWTKLSARASAMHQFKTRDGVRNAKWISPDGHREVVYTGKGKNQRITYDPRDVGTYNYYSHKQSLIGHTVRDVLPYLIAGNSEYDPTTKLDRIKHSVSSFLSTPSSNVKSKSVERGKKRVDKVLRKRKRKK